MKTLLIVLAILTLLFIAWVTWSYATDQNLEQPTYQIVSQELAYEIRYYEPYTVAQVSVAGDQSMKMNQAFMKLAGYIFGKNQERVANNDINEIENIMNKTNTQNIEMAMTIPVSMREDNKNFTMRFVLPSEWTEDTAPIPLDNDVQIMNVASGYRAILKYNGINSSSKSNKKKQELTALLEKDKVAITGDSEMLTYQRPWIFPLFQRHEISIPIAYDAQ